MKYMGFLRHSIREMEILRHYLSICIKVTGGM